MARKRPDNLIGWLLAFIGLGTLAYQTAAEYAIRGLLVEASPWPLANLAAVLSQSLWIIPFTAIPIVLLVYPTGSLIGRGWRWVVLAAIGSAAIVVLPITFILWSNRNLGAGLLREDNSGVLPEWPVTIALLLLVLAIVGSVFSLIIRWRSGEEVVRLQLKWLLLAGFLIVAQGISIFLTPDLEGPGAVAQEVLLLAGLIGVPISVGLSVMRYRLFEIDRIISRTVTYGLLTAVLALVYLGLVVMLRSLFPVVGSLPVAASTLAVAALFSPIRRQLQGLVAKRFNRANYDADRALSALSGRLREQIDLEPLRDEMAGFAKKTVQPTTVSVWLK